MMFYDTHAHLDFQDFAADLSAVLDRAHQAQVTRIVTVGTDFESSEHAVALADRYQSVFAVVGWHPGLAMAAPEDVRPLLSRLARHPKVVAIGETGLDYHRMGAGAPGSESANQREMEKQRQLFVQQLELAAEHGLNVVVHQREALQEVLDLMKPFRGRVRGQFHCFVGDKIDLDKTLAKDAVVSFTGILTFKNAAALRMTFAEVPVDSFMLETDCPYLAPEPFRGKRAEPAHLIETARVAADLKSMSVEALGQVTRATAERFFGELS